MASAGKQVGQRLYISAAQLSALELSARELVDRARALIEPQANEPFNVFRVDATTDEVAFLYYPDLGLTPFPALKSSCRINVRARLVSRRRYDSSLNPPILHRTELLLASDHPAHAQCVALTRTCESLGLFDHAASIGFKQQWESLVAERGFVLAGFELVPLANAAEPGDPGTSYNNGSGSVERHLTALARTTLSAPVQSLIRDGLLTTASTFFDYGCGRGDDLATLAAAGYAAVGWDPHYRPAAERLACDVVNIGFVINVIEDKAERIEALTGAYALARRVLTVSAMLGSNEPSKGRPFGDGVLTGRNTFQKYYSQGELRGFIESVLDEEAYPAAPGVFYVFRDRNLEQRYLVAKSSNTYRVKRLLAATPAHVRNYVHRKPEAPSAARVRRARASPAASALAESPEAQQELSKLWELMLDFGRVPDADEIPFAPSVKRLFGSVKRAIERCLERHDLEALRRAEHARKEDILVMFALRAFDRRRKFGRLESRLAKDVRTLFASVATAEGEATKLLFSLQDSAAIQSACECAAIEGLGWLEPGESLQLHTSLVPRLPASLRIYVGCASIMAGDISTFDLVKAHINSGKVTLLAYDDFQGRPLPLLRRRVKVRLRDQDLDVFDYDERHPPSVLFRKSRYINEEFPKYAEQLAFEEQQEALGEFDLDSYGPAESVLNARLAARRYAVSGFDLVRSADVPDLDSACGRHYRFRDLIECGETWTSQRPLNVPARPESYNALCDLATEVLDPVIEYFGAIELTYGFSSPNLAARIRGRIAPELDQHAACEVSRSGRTICSRHGAAVDFLVKDENMSEVARWISEHCRFDRMYFYGADRPMHVSIGPENARAIYRMVKSGARTIPRRMEFPSVDA